MTDETDSMQRKSEPWFPGRVFSRFTGFVSRHMMPLFVSSLGVVGFGAVAFGLSISTAGILVGFLCIGLLVLSGMGV